MSGTPERQAAQNGFLRFNNVALHFSTAPIITSLKPFLIEKLRTDASL